MILLEKSCGACCLLWIIRVGKSVQRPPQTHTHTDWLSNVKAIMQILSYVLGPY